MEKPKDIEQMERLGVVTTQFVNAIVDVLNYIKNSVEPRKEKKKK